MKNNKTKKSKEAIITLTCCAVIVAVCLGLIAKSLVGQTNKNTSLDAEETSFADVFDAPKSPFAIIANAEELIPGQPAQLVDNENVIYTIFSSGYDGAGNYDIKYTVPIPLLVEGEDIEYVTYSISQGAFQIISKDENYVKDGLSWDAKDCSYDVSNQYANYSYPDDDPGEFSDYAVDYYTQFNIDYENQANQKDGFNFVGHQAVSEELYNKINSPVSNSDYMDGLNELLNQTLITVSAHYLDGTENSQTLSLGSIEIKDPYAEDNSTIVVVSCTLNEYTQEFDGSKEDSVNETDEIVNTWSDTTLDELENHFGALPLPSGHENDKCSKCDDIDLAQVEFALPDYPDLVFDFRVEFSNDAADISGLKYDSYNERSTEKVNDCPTWICTAETDKGNAVFMYWYDSDKGLTYNLSVLNSNLSDFDLYDIALSGFNNN